MRNKSGRVREFADDEERSLGRRGVRINIGALVCNRQVDCLVEPLRKLFPHMKILHAYELADYIRDQEIVRDQE